MLFSLAIAGALRTSSRARFFALGMLLATLPVSAQFPHDRLLLFIGVGAAPLIALLIASILQPRAERVGTALERGAGYVCLGLHLVLAPLLLPLRVLAPMHGERMVAAADRSLPADAAVRDQTLVLVNPPVDAFAGFLPPTRSAQRRPRPRAVRWLATGTSDVMVERLDARTLRVRPEAGFLAQPAERMQRDPKQRLPVGHRIRYSDLTIEISAETSDQRPARSSRASTGRSKIGATSSSNGADCTSCRLRCRRWRHARAAARGHDGAVALSAATRKLETAVHAQHPAVRTRFDRKGELSLAFTLTLPIGIDDEVVDREPIEPGHACQGADPRPDRVTRSERNGRHEQSGDADLHDREPRRHGTPPDEERHVGHPEHHPVEDERPGRHVGIVEAEVPAGVEARACLRWREREERSQGEAASERCVVPSVVQIRP